MNKQFKIKATLLNLFLMINLLSFTQKKIDLLWLQNKVVGNKQKFENKKLKILFDSLAKNKVNIIDYWSPSKDEFTVGDTFKTNFIKIYFNEGYLKMIGKHSKSFFTHPQHQDTLNTHIPYIKIKFKQYVPFLRPWYDSDRSGLGSIRWNYKLRVFWGKFVVDTIEVGEY
jgi:hypothetical protein